MKRTVIRRNYLWLLCLGLIIVGTGVIYAQTLPYGVGETMTFKLYHGSLLAAEQTMHISEKTTYAGRPALKIAVTMESAGLGSIMKYNETSTLILDEKAGIPLYVRRDVEEKDGKYWIEIVYNMATKQLVRKSTKSGQEVTDTYSVENGCMEDLSLYYYLRTRPWAKGDKDFFFLKKQGVERFVLAVKDGEELKTPVGKFKTDMVENPDSGYTLWFSKDEKALPLMIKKGKITSKLVKISNS